MAEQQQITAFRFKKWYDFDLTKILVDKVTNTRVTKGKSFANRVSTSAEFFTDFVAAKAAAISRISYAIEESKRKTREYEEQLLRISSLTEDTVKEESTL